MFNITCSVTIKQTSFVRKPKVFRKPLVPLSEALRNWNATHSGSDIELVVPETSVALPQRHGNWYPSTGSDRNRGAARSIQLGSVCDRSYLTGTRVPVS